MTNLYVAGNDSCWAVRVFYIRGCLSCGFSESGCLVRLKGALI